MQCSSCNKKFATKGTLKTHSLIHDGKKNYTCDCGKLFRTKGNLQVHQYKSCLKKYECACNKKFYTKGALKAHSLTHTKNRCKKLSPESVKLVDFAFNSNIKSEFLMVSNQSKIFSDILNWNSSISKIKYHPIVISPLSVKLVDFAFNSNIKSSKFPEFLMVSNQSKFFSDILNWNSSIVISQKHK